MNDDFSLRILAWYDEHGRYGLPWLRLRTPYRVWIAEIMLQQTQVATVTPYYERFMAAFPDLPALASADRDEVMVQWAGLGYYARARNLHRTARIVLEEHQGQLPETIDGWLSLPGVGRSTAGAILAQAFGQRHPILDANVRRILTRYFGVDGWTGASAVNRRLWSIAESLLPQSRLADYTQALMDLGATVCRAGKPKCGVCPLASECFAFANQRTSVLPTPRPRRPSPKCSFKLLLVQDANERWLFERRPSETIWRELWCPPMVAMSTEGVFHLRSRLGIDAKVVCDLMEFNHMLSHRNLVIYPTVYRASCSETSGDESARWLTMQEIQSLGVPTPVSRLFNSLQQVQSPLSRCRE